MKPFIIKLCNRIIQYAVVTALKWWSQCHHVCSGDIWPALVYLTLHLVLPKGATCPDCFWTHLMTPWAKTINVFRACLGAQLTICAQKWRNFVLFSTVSLKFVLSRVCVFFIVLAPWLIVWPSCLVACRVTLFSCLPRVLRPTIWFHSVIVVFFACYIKTSVVRWLS